MMKHFLEKENYSVDLAKDGEEGLYRLQEEIYDLAVLDVMMPRMNGLEVLKKIREKNSKLLVLMLTARSELEDKLAGLDLGADDYMTKPFEMKELMARIRAMLRRRMPLEEEGLSYGDLRLDKGSVRLRSTTSGQEITLGNKEYLLMEYLMMNPDRILSKEQISDRIWGYESSVEYNNAEVYISFLRKKMGFLDSQVRIRAARGMGYSLTVQDNEP